jgi:hypothetical protein
LITEEASSTQLDVIYGHMPIVVVVPVVPVVAVVAVDVVVVDVVVGVPGVQVTAFTIVPADTVGDVNALTERRLPLPSQ